MESYEQFFGRATGFQPYNWQKFVAENGFPDVLPVPTGLGKTEGVVLAWAWRLLTGKGEPRHLVYCLPMRTLVRQTVERLCVYFRNLNQGIQVYQLMGGAIEDDWACQPEQPWVLVGTQDQLLSRALNRGYAMSRFEWPVHFGLLNNDCRWIIDEVQLMGPGLWTTAQLDWMRKKRFGTLLPCLTTWMSATVGTSFLETSDRKNDGLGPPSCLPPEVITRDSSREIQRRLGARKSIERWVPHRGGRKSAGQQPADFWSILAREVSDKHVPGTLSLVICNTVEAARKIYENLPDRGTPRILLTSRFRRQDRQQHEQVLLDFEKKRKAIEAEREHQGRTDEAGKPLPGDPGLICVSTQVVEAGVDVSAHHLWSEYAPWPAVIQRLGRLNRDGRDRDAKAWFWDAPSEQSKKKQKKKEQNRVGPYESEDVDGSKELIELLQKLQSDRQERPFAELLKDLASQCADRLDKAQKPKPEPWPRALDVHGLFSTERDVHGGFTDISSFVRNSDRDADLTVVWRTWQGGPQAAPPSGDDLDGPPINPATEGCPVPFYRLRDSLENTRENTRKASAWIWNEDAGSWEKISPGDLRPGMVVMLHRDAGGYSKKLGWTGDPNDVLDDVDRAGPGGALLDDVQTESGVGAWVALDVHLQDARCQAEKLCRALCIPDDLRTAVVEAAALHDLGKAHPQWQKALPAPDLHGDGPWAKCPPVLAVELSDPEARAAVTDKVAGLRPNAFLLRDERVLRNGKQCLQLRWALDVRLRAEELDDLRKTQGVLRAGHVRFRPDMRHEAASALAMWHRYRTGGASYPALAVYLAAAHHGKVRTVFRTLSNSGEDAFGVPPGSDPLQWNGQSWPLDFSVVKDGAAGEWTDQGFILKGYGWTGLVTDLLGPWRPDEPWCAGVVRDGEPKQLRPFKLAYLEALVRIADWRASESPSKLIQPPVPHAS
jgi:CRISPR-associated endonuclease/helicase Cas3